MLAQAAVTTIPPVVDLQRARDFYEKKLGLKAGTLKPDGKFTYTCAGGAEKAAWFKDAEGNYLCIREDIA